MRNSFLLNLDTNEVTLEDILKFITGCPTIPVIGFERKILEKLSMTVQITVIVTLLLRLVGWKLRCPVIAKIIRHSRR